MATKVVSEKQLQANRRNAAKSTGPRTPEGKAKSSRNALKHGLLAREVVIREGDGAENASEFEALMDRLENHFQPVGALEEFLVERVGVSIWRLRRAQRFEVGAIREELDDWEAGPRFQKVDNAIRELEQAKRELEYELQVAKWAEHDEELGAPANWDVLKRAWRELGREFDLEGNVLDSEQNRHEFLTYLAERDITNAHLRERLVQAQKRVVEQKRTRVPALEEAVDAARRYDELRRFRAALFHCLPTEDNVLKLVRYESMIDRQLTRSLHQLERLQRARLGEAVPPPLTLDVDIAGAREAG